MVDILSVNCRPQTPIKKIPRNSTELVALTRDVNKIVINLILFKLFSKSEEENDEQNCCFYSHYGIRVVEVRQQNGEVLKHWEFLDGEAQRKVYILMEDLFLDRAETVAIYDGNGECAVYNIANFKRTVEVEP